MPQLSHLSSHKSSQQTPKLSERKGVKKAKKKIGTNKTTINVKQKKQPFEIQPQSFNLRSIRD